MKLEFITLLQKEMKAFSEILNNKKNSYTFNMSKKNYKSQHEIQCGKSLYISRLIFGLDKLNQQLMKQI